MEIQLTEEQHRDVQQWAERLGLSATEAVLRCVTDRMTAVRVVDGGGTPVAPYWRLSRNV